MQFVTLAVLLFLASVSLCQASIIRSGQLLRSLADCNSLQVAADTATAIGCATSRLKQDGLPNNQCDQAQAFLDNYYACAAEKAPCAKTDCDDAKGITFTSFAGETCSLSCPGSFLRTSLAIGLAVVALAGIFVCYKRNQSSSSKVSS
jgi:hypothetical protein